MPTLRSSDPLMRSLGVAAAIFAGVGLGLIGLRAAGADVVAMLRDPAATPPNGSPLRGTLSDFGVLVMTATAVLALLAASSATVPSDG